MLVFNIPGDLVYKYCLIANILAMWKLENNFKINYY